MRVALRLARQGQGTTSPNPMVGALLVKGKRIIGRGWHRRAGEPHAEIEALRDAQKKGHAPRGSTLYVTLEPCCTLGRTPPCTDAIILAGIKRIVVGATDPNPRHSGKGFKILRCAGIEVITDILSDECVKLNEVFNHWILQHTPFVIVKAAMTLDGKTATSRGESKWITGEKARAYGMKLRHASDAILVGINTILADDSNLTVRNSMAKPIQRIILDSRARTPLTAKVVNDEFAALTTVVVSRWAPAKRVGSLAQKVNVIIAPVLKSEIDLHWLIKKLGAQNVTSLLVEGGAEVNASFLLGGLAQRIAFFYAPKILGGHDSYKAVAGEGAKKINAAVMLRDVEWRSLGADLLLTARVV